MMLTGEQGAHYFSHHGKSEIPDRGVIVNACP